MVQHPTSSTLCLQLSSFQPAKKVAVVADISHIPDMFTEHACVCDLCVRPAADRAINVQSLETVSYQA